MLYKLIAFGSLALSQGFVLNARPSAPRSVAIRMAEDGVVVPTAPATGAINPDIEKDSAKVVNMINAAECEGKGVYCRCWRSGTFPNCDGAHMKHNEATGDNVGPLIVDYKK